MKNKFIFIATLLVISFSVACNTVHGVGEDVQKGGQAIEKAAD